MDQTARAYLTDALLIMERHALYRDRIDWPALRAAAYQQAASARAPADTYAAIRSALAQIGDRHSFFAPPESGDAAIASGAYTHEIAIPTGDLRGDRIAYLLIPAFRGSADACASYTTTLHRLIAALDAAAPIGWMLDLTNNGGGNMLPMLSGLGPLLGTGVLGAFHYPGEQVIWRYQGGRLWLGDMPIAYANSGDYAVDSSGLPIAMLTSARTASSGEAVAIAFRRRPNTRSFGAPTRGLTSANESFELGDGATIHLTVALFADRTGASYNGPIAPDTPVAGDETQIQFAAAAWILTNQA